MSNYDVVLQRWAEDNLARNVHYRSLRSNINVTKVTFEEFYDQYDAPSGVRWEARIEYLLKGKERLRTEPIYDLNEFLRTLFDDYVMCVRGDQNG